MSDFRYHFPLGFLAVAIIDAAPITATATQA